MRAKVEDFQPQNLSNTAWAFAALSILTETFMDSIAVVAMRRIDLFDAQALTNTAWAYAKIEYIPPWMLDVLMEQATQKMSEWSPQHLSSFAWSFASVTFRSRKLMDALAKEVANKVADCEAQDLSNTVWSFARLGIVHYTLLAAIAAMAATKVMSFTAQNLANTAWAFATLAIRDRLLLSAIAAEAIRKCHEFSAQHLGNTVWAFSVLSMQDAPLMMAISEEARRHIFEYDLAALTWLTDYELIDDEVVHERLASEVVRVWRSLPDSPGGLGQPFLEMLQHVQVDSLGGVGSRMLLGHLNVRETDPAFDRRALEVIEQHRVEDPRENPQETMFGGPTRHKHVFSYAEYRIENFSQLGCSEDVVEGAVLQENGARSQWSVQSPLQSAPLPINRRVDRAACSEFLLLSTVCIVLRDAGACGQHERSQLVGLLRLWSTGPSCLSCLAAIRQFQLLFPGVQLEIGFPILHVAETVFDLCEAPTPVRDESDRS